MACNQNLVLVSFDYSVVLETKNKQKDTDAATYDSVRSELNFSTCFEGTSGVKYSKLCYSGQKCQHIPDALIKLYGSKVHSLDISYNEIATLRGLEKFENLKELVLDNNQLTDNMVLPILTQLETLSLNKNNICDIDCLLTQIKEKLPKLRYLSLLGNRACPNQLSGEENDEEDYQRYRFYVLHHVPNLKFLDSNKVTESERHVASRRGKYMNVVRPKTNILENEEVLERRRNFTPLPRSVRSPEDHRGAYGKCKYRYSGKHSEGNRFISNDDL